MLAPFNLMLSSALLDLPPTHQFITWVSQSSLFSLLDFILTHDSATCTSASALALSVAKHVLTRGLLLTTLGLVNSIMPLLVPLRQKSDLARLMKQSDDSQPLVAQPPLSSFGIYLDKVFMGPRILALLSWADATAHALSLAVEATTLAVSFYGSLMVVISVYFQLSRFMKLPEPPSEALYFALIVFFMLGSMSRLDVIPTLEYIEKKLEHSKDVMEDLLPGFMVEALMTTNPHCEPDPEDSPHPVIQAISHHISPQTELNGCHTSQPKPPGVDYMFELFENDEVECTQEDRSPVLGFVPPLLSSPTNQRQQSWRSFITGQPSPVSPVLNITQANRISYERPLSSVKQSQRHDCVTVFFGDLVGFSAWSHTCDPDLVMKTLDDLFTRLDDIILDEMPGLYKIETVGDEYIVAANLIDKDERHALTTVRFALRAQHEASQVFEPGTTKPLQMRIGLHSGPVTAGIVGKIRKRYCLFGDTMNMCARTETSCPPGSVQLTAATYGLLQDQTQAKDLAYMTFIDRGLVEVKGSDKPLHMFLASEVEMTSTL